MNKFDFLFASSMIRAPWPKRLQDRTFLGTLGVAFGAVGGCIAAWNTREIPIGDKVNLTIGVFTAASAVIAAWNHGEKSKDAKIGVAALTNSLPDTINAAGDVNLDTPKDEAAQSAPVAAMPEPPGMGDEIKEVALDMAEQRLVKELARQVVCEMSGIKGSAT